jgi:ankyrin repeat protein
VPIQSEVARLNLEYYRKQAKSLLRLAKAGDSAALQRIQLHSSPPGNSTTALEAPALHHAQLAIAREQGFPSWPRFKTFLIDSQLDFQGQVTAFIDASLSDLRRAQVILARNPRIVEAGFYVALVLGISKRVEEALTVSPALANSKCGPQNREPLLYVCFSHFANGRSNRAGHLAETARLLLRHGAYPNALFIQENYPQWPLPCLYGATGLNNNPELALVLLEAGADPNDVESLYHSTEHPDHVCTKLLLEHGATANGHNALKHMLDREDIEGLQILLSAGADPNETNERGETALHWAVWRMRSAETIAMLLDHGADINFKRNDGRTAYALAVVSAQTEIAALLRARGADTDLSSHDNFVAEFVSAITTAGSEKVEPPPATRPEQVSSAGSERLLPDLAASHRTSAVRALIAAGMPIDARGEAGGTALHQACWKGYADVAQLLIEAGASLTLEDTEYHAQPAGWLHHGTRNCSLRDEDEFDYARVARLLIQAGAPMQHCNTPTGNAEVDAVLREHKLIH